MTRGPIPVSIREQVALDLQPGVDEAACLAASVAIGRWSAGQPGFERRCLTRGSHGSLLDLIFWSNRASADRATERRRRDMGGPAFSRMIDEGTVETVCLPAMARKALAGLMLAV